MFQVPIARCIYCLEWAIACSIDIYLDHESMEYRRRIRGRHLLRGTFDRRGACVADSAQFTVSPYANLDAYDFDTMWLPNADLPARP